METNNSKLLINARDAEELRVVMCRDNKIDDLRWHRGGRPSLVGNIYLGVVSKVETSLDAAFVDFGAGRAGFIHTGNLHASCNHESDPFELASTTTRLPKKVVAITDEDQELAPEPSEKRSISEMLKPGQKLVVQVQRDALRGKGATLSSFISIPGRRLVFMPSLGRTTLSRRISDTTERKRLREEVINGEEFVDCGLILRTAASGSSREDLLLELEQLQKDWHAVGEKMAALDAPGSLRVEPSPAARSVRDFMRKDLGEIICDCSQVFEQVEALLEELGLENPPKLKLYKKSRPLFEAEDVERAWQLLFRAKVPLTEGASVVIHQTEALCAIDVNSGRIQGADLEETALATNLAAAAEIARQIRLRDLGGIVVVDFIDMRQAEHRHELDKAFTRLLRGDRARLKSAGLGAFGLFTLTRRRMGGGLPNPVESFCGDCAGSGSLAMHHAGALRALRVLRAIDGAHQMHLRIHPAAATILEPWLQELTNNGLKVRIEGDRQLAPGDSVLK